jgi:molybdopterin converting factor small subunit
MSYIKVKVKYLAPYIKNLIGIDEEFIEIEKGSTIKDVILKLVEVHGKHVLTLLLKEGEKDLREGILIALNDIVVQSINHRVSDGDIISIFITVNGG